MKSELILVISLLSIAFIAPALGQTNASERNESDLFNKAVFLYSIEKYDESAQTYDEVLKINPRNERAWNNRGIDLGMLGGYDDALQSFHNALEINSSYAEAWFNIGVIYDFEGDYGSAVDAYTRATEINPSYKEAWHRRDLDEDLIGIGHTSLYNELSHGAPQPRSSYDTP